MHCVTVCRTSLVNKAQFFVKNLGTKVFWFSASIHLYQKNLTLLNRFCHEISLYLMIIFRILCKILRISQILPGFFFNSFAFHLSTAQGWYGMAWQLQIFWPFRYTFDMFCQSNFTKCPLHISLENLS